MGGAVNPRKLNRKTLVEGPSAKVLLSEISSYTVPLQDFIETITAQLLFSQKRDNFHTQFSV